MPLVVDNQCPVSISVIVSTNEKCFKEMHAQRGAAGFWDAVTWNYGSGNEQVESCPPNTACSFDADPGEVLYVSVARERPESIVRLSRDDLEAELKMHGLEVSGTRQKMKNRLWAHGVETDYWAWAWTDRAVREGERFTVVPRDFEAPVTVTEYCCASIIYNTLQYITIARSSRGTRLCSAPPSGTA